MTVLTQIVASAQRVARATGPQGRRAYDLIASRIPRGPTPLVRRADGRRTAVDEYWADHTIVSGRFPSGRASLEALEERFALYPLYSEYFDLWGSREGKVVLDYGCGPGHDLTGFALFSGAKRVIGMDISLKALSICAHRLSLHRVEPRRVELIQVLDGEPRLPLKDASVDHVHTAGVLHHTPDPVPILEEILRVLKPGGTARVMVYNRDSVFFHLIVAYARMILNGEHRDLDVDDAFARMTDGPDCPVSIAYRPADWLALCAAAGFEAEFLGGHFSTQELRGLESLGMRALLDDRLAAEHRDFLLGLSIDGDGYPIHDGRAAGSGGSYLLRKPESDQATAGVAVKPRASSTAPATNGQITSA
jgi:SAM-dependent methyltransferase